MRLYIWPNAIEMLFSSLKLNFKKSTVQLDGASWILCLSNLALMINGDPGSEFLCLQEIWLC